MTSTSVQKVFLPPYHRNVLMTVCAFLIVVIAVSVIATSVEGVAIALPIGLGVVAVIPIVPLVRAPFVRVELIGDSIVVHNFIGRRSVSIESASGVTDAGRLRWLDPQRIQQESAIDAVGYTNVSDAESFQRRAMSDRIEVVNEWIRSRHPLDL